MNWSTKQGLARAVVVALLALALFNVLGILNSVPKAYAVTQCSSGYYKVIVNSGNTGEYGTYGVLQATSWSYDGDTTGHMNVWVDTDFPAYNYFVQAGVFTGKAGSYDYTSTRYPYLEYFLSGSDSIIYVSELYSISGSDLTQDSTWASSYGNGAYTYTLQFYSPDHSWTWNLGVNTGTYGTGTPKTAGESYYSTGGENCDLYYNYHSSLSYTSAYGSSPTWSSWTYSSVTQQDGSYQYQYNSYHAWNTYLTG